MTSSSSSSSWYDHQNHIWAAWIIITIYFHWQLSRSHPSSWSSSFWWWWSSSRWPSPSSELFLLGRYCTGMDLHCTAMLHPPYLPLGYHTHILHWYIILVYYTEIVYKIGSVVQQLKIMLKKRTGCRNGVASTEVQCQCKGRLQDL